MKFIYTIGFLFISALAISQDYFSRIIPTTDNPLVKKVKKIEDQYIIPADFFSLAGVQGGILLASDQNDQKVKFDNMDLASDPILIKEDATYFLGENPFRQGDSTFFVSKVDNFTFEQQWYKEYTIEHPKLNPRTILATEDNIFIVNLEIKVHDGNHPQEISVFAFDFDGNVVDIWKYNTNMWSSFPWISFISSDNSLIISSLVSYPQPGTYSQVLKIDQEGDIIWNYEGNERLDNGAVPTWAIELSDSTILQTYYVDRRNDVDFIVNNWFPEPNKFIWLSKDGELVREKLIITDKEDFLLYYGLKSGRGSYFYAYGYLESLDPDPGLKYSCHLTKFSNLGDTLWTHNYRHPLYPDNNILYNIKDIIEEENGDITILADITPPAAKTEVWLFKVNSEGCFVNEECEDMTTITSTDDLISNHHKIYPNPTSGIIHLEWQSTIKEIKVLNTAGKVLKKITADSNSFDLELLDMDKGIYILQVLDVDNEVMARKIIKI